MTNQLNQYLFHCIFQPITSDHNCSANEPASRELRVQHHKLNQLYSIVNVAMYIVIKFSFEVLSKNSN